MNGESLHQPCDEVELFARTLIDIEHEYKQHDPANATKGVFAEAAHEALELPYFRELVEDMLMLRAPSEFDVPYNLLLRGYQSDLLKHDPNYPHGYRDVDKWLTAFEEIEQDDERKEMLWVHACLHNVQSNVAERYKSVKLLAATLADRFDGPPSHLDVGSSVGHGNVKLVYNHSSDPQLVPFEPIEVIARSEIGELVPGRDNRLSKLVNHVLEREVPFGHVMGIDITNINDPAVQRWAKSCSFYPDELLNKRRVAEYNQLDELDPNHERTPLFRGDFSASIREFRDASPVDKYDIITFSTMLYQVSHQERTAMMVNAINLLSPNGIIVIQDAPDGNFSKKYNYVTSVIDGMDIGAGEQDLLRWESGRCQRAAVELGHIGINGTKKTIADALEDVA